MESKKVRNSNIELLRILSMVLIILYHISLHAVRYQLTDLDSITRMGNGLFCNRAFSEKLLLVQGMMPFGLIANAVFILISGYFMVEKGKNINLGRISKKLLLQIGFVAVLLTVASTVYYRIASPGLYTITGMKYITDFNSMNWFVGYYLLVMVIAGLFFNGFLEKLDQKSYTILLLTCFAVFSLAWSGKVLDELANGLRTLACGVFLYALGGYIKRYDPFRKIKAWALIAVILLVYALIFLTFYNAVQNAIHASATALEPTLFTQPVFNLDNFSIVPIVIAVALLELFKRLRIPDNRYINFIASGTFMIYLLHDNSFWRSLWRERDWVRVLWENPFLYCLKLLKWTAFVFAVGVLAYLLYLGLGKLCMRCKKAVLKAENDPAVLQETAET